MVEQTMKMVMDDAVLEQITDMIMAVQGRESTIIPMLRQQLAETEKSIENMLNAIQQGIITASTKERLDKLEATKAELKIALLQEEITRPLLPPGAGFILPSAFPQAGCDKKRPAPTADRQLHQRNLSV